jgi:hypothetical protein
LGFLIKVFRMKFYMPPVRVNTVSIRVIFQIIWRKVMLLNHLCYGGN